MGLCEHEKNALKAYKTKMLTSHEELNITYCGFYVSIEHLFLGASPDALIECKCCGLGVVEIKCPLCAQESSFTEAANGKRDFCLEECCDGKYQLKRHHKNYYQCQLQIL